MKTNQVEIKDNLITIKTQKIVLIAKNIKKEKN